MRPGEFLSDELSPPSCSSPATRPPGGSRPTSSSPAASRAPTRAWPDGTISADRADTIAAATGFLSDEDAAQADEILAAAAPGLRVDQLGRKAAALEMKLDPEAVRIRKEHAKRAIRN